MSLRLIEVIEALRQRERNDEADYYEMVVPFELFLIHNLSENKVLNMTVDEIEAWYKTPPKPLKYGGWNFWWGKAAYAENNH